MYQNNKPKKGRKEEKQEGRRKAAAKQKKFLENGKVKEISMQSLQRQDNIFKATKST